MRRIKESKITAWAGLARFPITAIQLQYDTWLASLYVCFLIDVIYMIMLALSMHYPVYIEMDGGKERKFNTG
jgi:hypothetical protein